METVGIRELKKNLSGYLRIVASGRKVVVTRRNKEIAVIVPSGLEGGNQEKAWQLVREGSADWSGGKPQGMSRRIRTTGKDVSDAVVEDRR